MPWGKSTVIPKNTYFSSKTMHFFGKKIRFSFFSKKIEKANSKSFLHFFSKKMILARAQDEHLPKMESIHKKN
tara:strand:+ start:333 stop:551 length:219 start_codon:yes stop_codon:yes gene_type:complete